jgi:hypothetical protein
MSIQELIENIDSNIKLIRVWEKESVHPGMANAHRQHANNLEEKKALIQTLQSEHKAEIEAAYSAGYFGRVEERGEYKSAEDYYQKTFKK